MADKTIETIAEELAAPFPAHEIEWRANRFIKKGEDQLVVLLAYITARGTQDRFDEVFGIDSWTDAYSRFGEKGVLCTISAQMPGGAWITKTDGADDTNIESTKGGISDAYKRAGYKWGVGRYLYWLDECIAPVREQRFEGAIYVSDEKKGLRGYCAVPILPDWALPGGSGRPPVQTPNGKASPRSGATAKPPVPPSPSAVPVTPVAPSPTEAALKAVGLIASPLMADEQRAQLKVCTEGQKQAEFIVTFNEVLGTTFPARGKLALTSDQAVKLIAYYEALSQPSSEDYGEAFDNEAPPATNQSPATWREKRDQTSGQKKAASPGQVNLVRVLVKQRDASEKLEPGASMAEALEIWGLAKVEDVTWQMVNEIKVWCKGEAA